MSKRVWRKWTADDIGELRRLVPIKPTRNIAKVMGRTEDAIKAMCSKLGIRPVEVFMSRFDYDPEEREQTNLNR